LFNRNEKKSKSTKPLKDLVPVIPVERLLDDKKRQPLLQQINTTIGLDASGFHKFALPVIHNMARHCQQLPETSLYYSHAGGFIDRALNRTEAALHLVRHILVLEQHEKPSEEQKIWLYALFSAAMLKNVGALYTDYNVDLFDTNGQLIKRWQPLLEDLSSTNKYYDYHFLRGDDIVFRNRITLLIARQIMPNTGFTWLTSNPDVFAVWLALLQEDRDSAGPLAAIFDRADAIAMQRDINDYLTKNAAWIEGAGNRMSTFTDTTPMNDVDKERLMGAEFIAWLTQNLEQGNIIINKVPMLMEVLPTGIVMSPQLFDMFAQEHRKFKNKAAVQQAFLAWNMHLLTDAAKDSLSSGKSQQAVDSIPINTAILPEKVKIYQAKTGKITTTSSVDLIHNMQSYSQANPADLESKLSHLSAAGKWVTHEEVSVQPHYGRTQRA